jgi:hypothetical protein
MKKRGAAINDMLVENERIKTMGKSNRASIRGASNARSTRKRDSAYDELMTWLPTSIVPTLPATTRVTR